MEDQARDLRLGHQRFPAYVGLTNWEEAAEEITETVEV